MTTLVLQNIPSTKTTTTITLDFSRDSEEEIYADQVLRSRVCAKYVAYMTKKNSIYLSPESFTFWDNPRDEIYDTL